MENIYRKEKKEKTEFNSAVGKRLKMLRKAQKLTQEKLAEKINVTFQQIQKYEKGTNGLTLKRADQIAKCLSINPSYFLENIESEIITENETKD